MKRCVINNDFLHLQKGEVDKALDFVIKKMHIALGELIDKLYTEAIDIDPNDNKYINYIHIEKTDKESSSDVLDTAKGLSNLPLLEFDRKTEDDDDTVYRVTVEDSEWVDPVLDKMMVRISIDY